MRMDLSAVSFSKSSPTSTTICTSCESYSGTVKSGSRMLNPRTGKKEMMTKLWHIQADSRELVDQDAAQAGDIVGVVGSKDL